MKSKITFGRWEAITLLINSVCTQVFLNFPRMTVETAGTAGWIMTIYISLLAFLSFFVIYKLYKGFEGKDLLDISEYLGGKVLGIIVGLIIVAFLIAVTSIVLREFAEDMKVISLVVSPISFVTVFFVICMAAGAFFGLESIVRYHAIVVPIIAVGYLAILIGVLPYYNAVNLTPILGTGVSDIFVKGTMRLSVFSIIILLLFITPFIGTNKNLKSIGIAGLSVSSLFLLLSSLSYISAVPYPTNTEYFLPIYHFARMINYGRFFQRIESFFVLIWAAAAFLVLSTTFFFIVYIFKKTFKLDYYRPLILPFAVLVFNCSLLPQSLMDTITLETKYYRNYGWLFTIALSILILLFARIKRKFQKKEA